jgi:hypothetical protein
MQEARQRLQMTPHIREQHLELLVAVGARKSHTLHALVNRHGMTPSVVELMRRFPPQFYGPPASAFFVPAADIYRGCRMRTR